MTSDEEERDDKPTEEWKRSINPTLWPGMDYRNDRLYYTAPIHIERFIKGTKTKPDQNIIEWGAEVISSQERESFRYDALTLKEMGFTPYEGMVIDQDQWSGEPVAAWLNGADTTTEPLDIWQRIRTIWTRYIDFGANEAAYDICAIFTMLTYCYKVFESVPYLKYGGTMESGKSQNLRLLDTLGFNPLYGTAMTGPVLFRSVASAAGLVLIDEFEGKPGDDKYEDIASLIRLGYKKGGAVTRLEPDKRTGKYIPVRYPVYGPKAIASISTLDEVTASRVIEITMEPTLRTIAEFKSDRSAYAHLINDLHYFGLAHAPHIAQRNADWTVEHRQGKAPGITNRAWEIAGPIIVLADYIGGDAMTEPLIEWFTAHFAEKKKRQDSSDAHRTLIISLPQMLKDTEAYADGYYLASELLKNYMEFSDDDKKKTKLKPRVLKSWMAALGFKVTRPGRGGTQIQVTEEALRHVFNQRRVTPRDEDLQWLAGETSYQTVSDQQEPSQTEFDLEDAGY